MTFTNVAKGLEPNQNRSFDSCDSQQSADLKPVYLDTAATPSPLSLPGPGADVLYDFEKRMMKLFRKEIKAARDENYIKLEAVCSAAISESRQAAAHHYSESIQRLEEQNRRLKKQVDVQALRIKEKSEAWKVLDNLDLLHDYKTRLGLAEGQIEELDEEQKGWRAKVVHLTDFCSQVQAQVQQQQQNCQQYQINQLQNQVQGRYQNQIEGQMELLVAAKVKEMVQQCEESLYHRVYRSFVDDLERLVETRLKEEGEVTKNQFVSKVLFKNDIEAMEERVSQKMEMVNERFAKAQAQLQGQIKECGLNTENFVGQLKAIDFQQLQQEKHINESISQLKPNISRVYLESETLRTEVGLMKDYINNLSKTVDELKKEIQAKKTAGVLAIYEKKVQDTQITLAEVLRRLKKLESGALEIMKVHDGFGERKGVFDEEEKNEIYKKLEYIEQIVQLKNSVAELERSMKKRPTVLQVKEVSETVAMRVCESLVGSGLDYAVETAVNTKVNDKLENLKRHLIDETSLLLEPKMEGLNYGICKLQQIAKEALGQQGEEFQVDRVVWKVLEVIMNMTDEDSESFIDEDSRLESRNQHFGKENVENEAHSDQLKLRKASSMDHFGQWNQLDTRTQNNRVRFENYKTVKESPIKKLANDGGGSFFSRYRRRSSSTSELVNSVGTHNPRPKSSYFDNFGPSRPNYTAFGTENDENWEDESLATVSMPGSRNR